MKALLLVFLSVFIAELGDKTQKTQVATLLCNQNLSRVGVFVAASAALVFSNLLVVLVGAQISRFVPPVALKAVAGLGFSSLSESGC